MASSGMVASLAEAAHGTSAQTVGRWRDRFIDAGKAGLESAADWPAWGHRKIAAMMRTDGIDASTSTEPTSPPATPSPPKPPGSRHVYNTIRSTLAFWPTRWLLLPRIDVDSVSGCLPASG